MSNKEPRFSNEELIMQYQEGNSEALSELCEQNEKFIWKYANIWYKNANKRADPEDFFQEGMIGIITAAKKYDPNRNEASFLTYAKYYVINRMFILSSRVAGPVILSPYIFSKVLRIAKLHSLYKDLPFDERVEKISKEEHMAKDVVLEATRIHIQFLTNTSSISVPVGEEKHVPWIKYCQPRCTPDFSDKVCRDLDTKFAFDSVIGNISDFEMRCFSYYFGIYGQDEIKSYEELAKRTGVSKSQVYKAVNEVKRRIQTRIEDTAYNLMEEYATNKKENNSKSTTINETVNSIASFFCNPEENNFVMPALS